MLGEFGARVVIVSGRGPDRHPERAERVKEPALRSASDVGIALPPRPLNVVAYPLCAAARCAKS